MRASRSRKQIAFAPLRELRTTPPFYWIAGGIMGFTVILGISVSISKEPDFWIPTTITAFLLAATMALFVSTKLTLTDDTIHYRSFLIRKDFLLKDVIQAEFAFGFIAFSYKPYQRIILTVRNGSEKKEIILNGGLFDRGEINRWVETLNSKLS